MGASTRTRNQWIDSLPPLWGVPCTGDPGDTATSAAAVAVTGVARVLVERSAAAAANASNANAEEWPNFPAPVSPATTTTVKYMAYWDAQTGGNYVGSAPVASFNPATGAGGDPVGQGQTYRAAAGALTFPVT